MQCLELQDENGAFLETTTPESLKASIPAKVHEAYSSLNSLWESIVSQFAELPLVFEKPSVSQEDLETVDTEDCRLKTVG